ncbi:helix-turn-helix domain-containing protein [Kitasatospora griseola]|uniref:helix-turn-helix domain-containing protein n=1 Tax=Kitasatospora griseola TaxID=2064 RepID=UPI00380B80D1
MIVTERQITGLSQAVIADLVAELGPVWQAGRDAELLDRPRRRAVGAGAKHKLVFVDRLLATLVHLRHGVTHDVLACWFDVDRSTITRAIGQIRPLPAERGCRNRVRSASSNPRGHGRPPGRDRADRDHRRHRDPGPPPGSPSHGPQPVRLRQEPDERDESPGHY